MQNIFLRQTFVYINIYDSLITSCSQTCQMKLTEMQKENTKTRNSFKIVKKANGTLKQQVSI